MTEEEIHARLKDWRDSTLGATWSSDMNELYRTLVAILCPNLEAQARVNLEELCRKRQESST